MPASRRSPSSPAKASVAPAPAPASGGTAGRVLKGDGRYGWVALVDGDDLVVHGVRATWFGGPHDREDGGNTASNVSTLRHPDILGCALPMDGPNDHVCQGAPFPRLPYGVRPTRGGGYEEAPGGTQVEITCGPVRLRVPLIDLGPAAPPAAHAAIDLTTTAFVRLGGNLTVGELRVDFRVLGGARHLSPQPA